MTEFSDNSSASSETITFAERLATSDAFISLFQEGMGLVEETAGYLDGIGREESKDLERPASLAYATESMRLTTRLMQLASWLLLQRAVNDGEMTLDQASQEKNKVKLERLNTARHPGSWDELPQTLRDLIDRSVRLQERVQHLDSVLYNPQNNKADPAASNPVADQLGQLAAAFGSGAGRL
ncbi:MAG: DUF1465 family protein [Stappiaceae bacterium]